MPGTIPATSQLDRLISMTAINVLAGSRAMRDRLKLFNVCMGSSIGSQRAMDAISTPPPHSISHLGCMTAIACRIRSSACDTRAWLWVQYVLCWCAFPLAPALRSTDSAALAPADASAVGFLRFVLWRGPTSRVRASSASVPHLPDADHPAHATSDGQTRDLPGSDAIPSHVMCS